MSVLLLPQSSFSCISTFYPVECLSYFIIFLKHGFKKKKGILSLSSLITILLPRSPESDAVHESGNVCEREMSLCKHRHREEFDFILWEVTDGRFTPSRVQEPMSPGPEGCRAADSLEEGPRGTPLGVQAGECWHHHRERQGGHAGSC